MSTQSKSLFVNVDTVKNDLGVSNAKAYKVIKELNAELKKTAPDGYRNFRQSKPNLVRRSVLYLG